MYENTGRINWRLRNEDNLEHSGVDLVRIKRYNEERTEDNWRRKIDNKLIHSDIPIRISISTEERINNWRQKKNEIYEKDENKLKYCEDDHGINANLVSEQRVKDNWDKNYENRLKYSKDDQNVVSIGVNTCNLRQFKIDHNILINTKDQEEQRPKDNWVNWVKNYENGLKHSKDDHNVGINTNRVSDQRPKDNCENNLIHSEDNHNVGVNTYVHKERKNCINLRQFKIDHNIWMNTNRVSEQIPKDVWHQNHENCLKHSKDDQNVVPIGVNTSNCINLRQFKIDHNICINTNRVSEQIPKDVWHQNYENHLKHSKDDNNVGINTNAVSEQIPKDIWHQNHENRLKHSKDDHDVVPIGINTTTVSDHRPKNNTLKHSDLIHKEILMQLKKRTISAQKTKPNWPQKRLNNLQPFKFDYDKVSIPINPSEQIKKDTWHQQDENNSTNYEPNPHCTASKDNWHQQDKNNLNNYESNPIEDNWHHQNDSNPSNDSNYHDFETIINPCTVPKQRTFLTWCEKHQNNLQQVPFDHDIILTGDSLIANLRKHPIWTEFEALNAANFGIGGDKVENVLYRIHNGEFANKNTKIVVLLVGTNNSERCKPYDIYEGIMNCVYYIEEHLPEAHIILPTMLPRGREPNEQRDVLSQINGYMIRFKQRNFERKRIHVVAIHKNIVDDKGFISRDMMYDYLHLTSKGYKHCFQAVLDLIAEIKAKYF